jgi:hypothetical protein
MITVVALMLYTNQIESSKNAASVIGDETSSMYTDQRILNSYHLDYVVQNQENRRAIAALSYGCIAGNQGDKRFSHRVSNYYSVDFFPREFMARNLNNTVIENYYFVMDCDPSNSTSQNVSIGSKPPKTGPVTVKSVPVPLPYENRTTARLYRWFG